MGVSVSFPGPDVPDPFKEAGVIPTVIYGASMNPITIPPPQWIWIDNRGAATIGENIRLEASLDRDTDRYDWSVRVRYGAPELRVIIFRDSEEPVPAREDAEASAWKAIGEWLGAA
jgi:hypothetical protein